MMWYCLFTLSVCVCMQRNLTELIVAVDVGNLLQLYASMLFERRILIFASKLSTVRHIFAPLFCEFSVNSRAFILWKLTNI